MNTTHEGNQKIGDIRDLTERLKISRTIAYGLMREGMPHIRLNRRVIRFDFDEVQHWLESRRVGDVR